MKRMKSKDHGFTHAHDGNEEAYLRKLGWIEESESFPGEEADTPNRPQRTSRMSNKSTINTEE